MVCTNQLVAKQFGATECVNPKDHDKPIQQVCTHKFRNLFSLSLFSFSFLSLSFLSISFLSISFLPLSLSLSVTQSLTCSVDVCACVHVCVFYYGSRMVLFSHMVP